MARCSVCGRFIKLPNAYRACEYPRYCYEKVAMKDMEDMEPLANAVDLLFRPTVGDSDNEEE